MAVLKFSQREPGFNEYINHLGETVRIDPTLAHNILCLVEAAKATNGDCWIVITGIEGSGKSTLQRQLGKLVDRNFTEKGIEFNPEDFLKAHFKGLPENWDPKTYMAGGYDKKPWAVLALDESAKLDRKKTMSAGSVEFTGFSTQSRQLHQIVFIVLPNAHMLDGYIMEHRCVALIDCYKHEQTKMGFYRWFNRRHIKMMFNSQMHRQKLYPNNPSFAGRFSSREAFDITEYEKKKGAALNAYRKIEAGVSDIDPVKLAEIQEKIEMAAQARVYELGLDAPTVYKALAIPRKTWSDRKIKLTEQGLIPPEPPKGSLKRITEALKKHSTPVVDEYSVN